MNNNEKISNKNITEEQKKMIRELVDLYFEYNPHMNRGVGFKAKANDIIKAYLITHNKNYDDIKHCIESSPMCGIPIWEQFYNFFYKKKNNKQENSSYKSSVSDSTNVDDWI